jgi:dTDP-4-amino-4,6-dideoxygalactose transaminase/UDP-N-acetylmuramyl pentapeptide phosphotransferase/UDP-N-acetylglucosamine-1-phosphate transferase
MSPDPLLLGVGAFAVALVTWLLVGVVIRLAPNLGLMDRPNSRSSHTRLTPRGGGLGFVVTLALALAVAVAAGIAGLDADKIMGWVMGLSLFIAAVSFSDDLRSLPSVLRLVLHLGSAAAAVALLGGFSLLTLPVVGTVALPHWLGVGLAMVWIVGLTNVYNFMDGIDGIAGVQGLVAGAAWAVIGMQTSVPLATVSGLAFAAACAGFLGRNWSPAQIFMGDVGSAFLGFSFAVMPLVFLQQVAHMQARVSAELVGALPVFAGLVVWPFIGDGTFTFLRRLRHGENVLKAHRSHLYQRLTISGWTHSRVSQLYLWWAAGAALAALAYVQGGAAVRATVLAAAVVSLLAVHRVTKAAERRAKAGVSASGLPQKSAPTMRPRLFLSPPHLGSDEFKFVTEAFENNWIAPAGPNLKAFEEEFAAKVGVKHAVAVASGTAALHLALRVVGMQRGDEVFVSSFTFIATANPIVYEGGRPVFIDSELESWNMDPSLLATALEERARKGKLPRAVIVAHIYGQTANMGPILEVCARHGVPVIEDAAEAVGATCDGKAAGSMGLLGAFSFNGNKIITTSGGGMLVSDDKALVDFAHNLATQARDPAPHYEHSMIGYNYRMSNVVAGIGRGQLRVLDDRVTTRRRIYERYRAALGELPGVGFRKELAWGRSTRWLTCLTIDPERAGVDREKVRLALEEENIEARPLWKPLHLQPVFRKMGCEVLGGGVSERLFENGLCLPSGSAMADSDQDRVIETVRRSFAR